MLLALALFAASQSVHPPDRAPVVIDMDAQVIEGSVYGPNDHVVAVRLSHKFKSLIELRRSFSRELLASAAQIPPK